MADSVRYLLKSNAATVVVAEQGATASRSHDTRVGLQITSLLVGYSTAYNRELR
mgnify:CR=1 FL=1